MGFCLSNTAPLTTFTASSLTAALRSQEQADSLHVPLALIGAALEADGITYYPLSRHELADWIDQHQAHVNKAAARIPQNLFGRSTWTIPEAPFELWNTSIPNLPGSRLDMLSTPEGTIRHHQSKASTPKLELASDNRPDQGKPTHASRLNLRQLSSFFLDSDRSLEERIQAIRQYARIASGDDIETVADTLIKFMKDPQTSFRYIPENLDVVRHQEHEILSLEALLSLVPLLNPPSSAQKRQLFEDLLLKAKSAPEPHLMRVYPYYAPSDVRLVGDHVIDLDRVNREITGLALTTLYKVISLDTSKPEDRTIQEDYKAALKHLSLRNEQATQKMKKGEVTFRLEKPQPLSPLAELSLRTMYYPSLFGGMLFSLALALGSSETMAIPSLLSMVSSVHCQLGLQKNNIHLMATIQRFFAKHYEQLGQLFEEIKRQQEKS